MFHWDWEVSVWDTPGHMVCGFFLSGTLAGKWWSQATFVHVEVEPADTCMKHDPQLSWKGHFSRVGTDVGNPIMKSGVVFPQPCTLHCIPPVCTASDNGIMSRF